MRILMPSRFLDRHVGGNTTYARKLADGLTHRGIEVGRIPAGRHPATTLLTETAAGLHSYAPQTVVHYTGDTGPLLPVRSPSVVTVHGVASRWIDVARSRLQERTWRERVRLAIRATDHVITVSNSSADDVAEVFGIDRERITTIEHGIDVEQFAAPAELSDDVRARVTDQFVLYLGNIEPRKNLLALIAAFEQPEVKQLGVPLVIAGKPAWNASETQEAIARAENVIQLGFVSDTDRVALMQACTLFAFPSLYEGFGFPVLEALAAGAPVITSDRGSLAEVAGPSLRFPGLDMEGLTHGVLEALADERELSRCVAEGAEWAARFTWDESITKHVSVYEGVLA